MWAWPAVTFFPAPLADSDLRHAISISDLGTCGHSTGHTLDFAGLFGMAAVDRRFSMHAMELKVSRERFQMMAEMNAERERVRVAEAASQAKGRVSRQYEP